MDWLTALQKTQPVAHAVLVLSMVSVLGLALGHVQVRKIGLGISGVLLAGIALGHFGVSIAPGTLAFVQEFGLILFVFTIGMQVGPGFFSSLRSIGLRLNALAALVVLLGALTTALASVFLGIDMAAAAGLFAGATTNTPALGAAQQALKSVAGLGLTPHRLELPALGYAATYPFGILGIILAMVILRSVFRIQPLHEAKSFQAQQTAGHEPVSRINLVVENRNLDGVVLRDIPGRAEMNIVISRLRLAGETEVRPAREDLRLHLGDTLLAVGTAKNLDRFRQIVGRASADDLREVAGPVDARRVVVTRKEMLGRQLRELGLSELYGVSVTRVTRGDLEMSATPSLELKFGDMLQMVGDAPALEKAAHALGNSVKELNHTDVLPMFLGIGLGVLAGLLPFHFAGMPVPLRLGLAGGPLIVAILLSRIGKIGPIVWYMPSNANIALRHLGIVLFLGCVGLKAGQHFFATLLSSQGLIWIASGAVITLLPLLVVGWIARHFLKMNFISICGLLSGSMTDPPALAFANAISQSESPSVAYATVYPLTMLLRILTAQVLILAFCR